MSGSCHLTDSMLEIYFLQGFGFHLLGGQATFGAMPKNFFCSE